MQPTTRIIRLLLVPALGLALVAPFQAGATTFTETFDNGSNDSVWSWGFDDTFVSIGGNPGWFFATDGLDTFAPRLRTTASGTFTGDYRTMEVTSIGIDLIMFSDSTAEGRPLTPMLIYDNGTPGDQSDDTAAYFLGPNIPLVDEGWISYDFDVPSQETSLPAGWLLLNLGSVSAPANHDWNTVTQNVSRLQWHYGDPTFFFIFQVWSLGADNIRITFVDGGGEPGNEKQVTICHRPPGNPENAHTIIVGSRSVRAHMAHGDTLGVCTESFGAVDRNSGETRANRSTRRYRWR
jgi:hypothetical protein